MDEPWVIERLQWWIKTARKARRTSWSSNRGNQVYGFMYDSSPHYNELRAASAQTHAIICRVLGRNNIPDLIRRADDAYWVDVGIEYAEHALAVMQTRAETQARLGTSAPTMKADALHPLIWDAASKRWESAHYSDAVQRAATALSGLVKDRTSRYELGDKDLMSQAFSLAAPQPGKPRLRWPGSDEDLTVIAMRQGILNLAQGAFSAIRNPATHTTDELPMQEALEQLATLSILTRWIDRCELQEAPA
ncbi:TIGR02391 family protein [Gryllotalpicola protaetiae]|uniref:Conserved hypothetical protein CHP02391 domain-containing protein n=1 Tax=Gryllotalpicola protaetiae TaxID=2419771 RepID=A0A387BR03_9MICO|nr:TIGR02391 family protein [Gryllotalpicola protaetiae]AYG03426.1 hypothetical protein D7I44_07675 [Gryllotalpicola protaetiae]